MSPRKSPIIAAALAVLTILTFRAGAQSPDAVGAKLFPPDFIMGNADAIGLTQEQRAALRDLVQGQQPRFVEMQEQLMRESLTLAKLVDQSDADEAALLAQFDKVMDRERDIKRAQVSLLLSLRKKLTEDQRTKLAKIRTEKNPNLPPQAMRDKAERVKIGATKWQNEGRDVAPIAELMQQLEPLMRAGKVKEAEAVLDQALKLLEDGK